MNPFIAPLAVFFAGLVGGIVNALMSGTKNIQLPATTKNAQGATVWRPGWTSSLVLGGVAALVSWALYGPDAGKSIIGYATPDLTFANLAAAVLIGIGGSRWLSAEVDKNVFKKAAVEAADSDKSADLASAIATGSPEAALKAAVAAN